LCETATVRRREKREDLLSDRADAALRNGVAGKRILPILRSIAAARAVLAGGGAADVTRQRIVNGHPAQREILAVADLHRDGRGLGRERYHFLQAFEAAEDEVLVLANGPARHAAELVPVVITLGGAELRLGVDGQVVLEEVRVENRVPPVIVDIAV